MARFGDAEHLYALVSVSATIPSMETHIRSVPKSLAPIVSELEFDPPTGPLTLDDLSRISGVPRDRVRLVASRLAQRGWLARVRPGLYEFVPAAEGYPSASEWRAFTGLRHEVVISGLTAAQQHGLTPQLPSRHVVIVRADRSVPRWLMHTERFRVVRLRPERVFGAEMTAIDGVQVPVACLERVLIDAVAHPRWFAGAAEVARIIRIGFPQASRRRLLEGVGRYDSFAVARRVGWWGERILGSGAWSAHQRNESLRGRRPGEKVGSLVPGEGRGGSMDTRWGLTLNVSEERLASEEAVR